MCYILLRQFFIQAVPMMCSHCEMYSERWQAPLLFNKQMTSLLVSYIDISATIIIIIINTNL